MSGQILSGISARGELVEISVRLAFTSPCSTNLGTQDAFDNNEARLHKRDPSQVGIVQATISEPCAGRCRSSIQGGEDDEWPENCVSTAEEVSGIHGDSDRDTGSGDRGECGGVQRDERRSAAASEIAECAESLHGAAVRRF